MIKAMILMAGAGERFASETPKQYHLLCGKKVYLHTLEQFLKIDQIGEILLVCEKSRIEQVQKEVETHPAVKVVEGGTTRQESSYRGLCAAGTSTRFVLIHDAVRPLVSKEILLANIEGVKRYGAVDTCIPSADTIVHAPGGQSIWEIPNRSDYLRGQTPQSFSYPLILEAHEHARKVGQIGKTDDCSLVLALGAKVHVVPGEERNLKITTQQDLKIAELLMGVNAPHALRTAPTP